MVNRSSSRRSQFARQSNAPADDRDGKQKILPSPSKADACFKASIRPLARKQLKGISGKLALMLTICFWVVSFVSDKQNQILLNTIQIAQPDRRSVEEVDTGIFVETFPVRPSNRITVETSPCRRLSVAPSCGTMVRRPHASETSATAYKETSTPRPVRRRPIRTSATTRAQSAGATAHPASTGWK